MAKLTPAQECAVELYKSHNTPIKRLRYLDNAAILNESGFPVYDVEIISRYIREAEQRGYDQASRDLAGVDGGDDVHYRPEAPHD